MSELPEKFISVNGKIIKRSEAVIPAVSSGLYYGAGCFETLRYDGSGLFRFSDHIRRLNRGLNYLGASESQFANEEEIKEHIQELIQRNQYQDEFVRVRIQASLQESKGYYRHEDAGLIWVITCEKITSQNDKPVSLITSKTRVIPTVCRPADLKLSNMLHYRQAFREAADAEADDALMLTTDGFVAECSVANIFWKKGNVVYTPSKECDILPGIMRAAVIEIMEWIEDYELVEGRFKPRQLMEAEATWLTNSIKEITAVGEIDGISCRQEPGFISEMKEGLEKLKQEEPQV